MFSCRDTPETTTFEGSEHQIDLIPGVTFPNHAAYRTKPEETKKIQ
jgi:hypothetical protein